MATPVRISATEARERTLSGEALLVCGYEQEEKFIANYLEGAITWQRFQSQLPEMSKEQEVVFYCA